MLDSYWQTLTAKQESSAAGTGLVLMDDLAVLSFTGSDVHNFLQGYFTCDTLETTADQLQPAAMCNLQGRVVAFGWASAPADSQICWLVPDSVVAQLRSFLKPYLAFSKTNLSLLPEDHLVLASMSSPHTGNLTNRLRLDIVRDAETLRQLLTAQGLGERNRIDLTLIEDRVPWLTSVNANQFLPQMLGLVDLHAINFAKGCYLGQEVVARAQHRGQVKRQLVGLTHATATALEPGSEIIDYHHKVVGTVISSAADKTTGRSLCVLQSSAQSPFTDRKTGLTMHS